jgi:acetolactate synthase-1/2/3 large subunit
LSNVIQVHSDATSAIVDILKKVKSKYEFPAKVGWWNRDDKNKEIQLKSSNIKNTTHLDSLFPLVTKIGNIAFTNKIDVYVDTGNTLAWVCNAISTVSARPRVFSSWNNTPMGYSLPAAIGACVSNLGVVKTVVCFIGDGGLSLCMSELALLNQHQLPVKVFVIENGGHNIQKQTIETWLSGRYAGVSVDDGLSMPNFEYFNDVFGFDTYVIRSEDQLDQIEQKLLDSKPYLFRVLVNEKLRSFPVVPYGKKLTDPICLR